MAYVAPSRERDCDQSAEVAGKPQPKLCDASAEAFCAAPPELAQFRTVCGAPGRTRTSDTRFRKPLTLTSTLALLEVG